MEETIVANITASEINRIIQTKQLSQVLDQVTSAGHKWFSLQDNVLDGSYKLFDANSDMQIGWWGTSLSDAYGSFASPPTLTIEEARSVHFLQVTGDSLLGEYPVDFTVRLYNGTSLLHTETVVGNTNVIYRKDLGAAYDVTSIKLSVSKVNKSSRVVKIVDVFSPFEINRADHIAPSFIDFGYMANGVFSADTVNIKIDGQIYASVNLSSIDNIKTKTQDNSFMPLYEIWRSDAVKPSTIDSSEPVTVALNSLDTARIKANESKNILASFVRPDSLVLNKEVEQDLITASFSSSDSVMTKLLEDKLLTNVHSRMNETYRQTFAKVEVTYSDPFLDETISISANSTAYNTSPAELADSFEKPSYKWLSLTDNKLDGTSKLIDDSRRHSVGWWSSVLSDANGYFNEEPIITVTFAPRAMFSLKVSGDEKLNNYPTDFSIKLYDTNDVVLEQVDITGNDKVLWTQSIETITDVVKLELVIHRINRPYDTAKITEFFTAIVETYYSDRIVDLSLLEELDYPSGSVSLGCVSANEIDIALDNSDGKFNLGDTLSPLHGLIKRNRRVRAWLGTEIVPGEVEWYPLGVFWTVGWDMPDQSLEIYTTARDRLELLRLSDFTTSEVYENYSLYQLFDIIFTDAGLVPQDYIIDAALMDLIIPYAWFDRMTHREAVQRLADCAYIQVYCDRNGKIRVERILTTNNLIFSFDNDTNIYSKSYPITASEVTNYVEVSSNAVTVKPMEEVLKVEESISIPAGTSLKTSYSFSSVPVKNVQPPVITGGQDLNITTQIFAWGIEVTFENTTSSTITVSSLVVQGQPLELNSKAFVVAKDDALIKDNGKLRVSVEHDFIQSVAYANVLASTLLEAYKQSLYDVSIQARGNIGLYLGQKVQVNDSRMNTNYQYITQRQTINWNGALSATVDGKKI